MKKNEYDAAEVAEIGKADELILGLKENVPDLDFSGEEPRDWRFDMVK